MLPLWPPACAVTKLRTADVESVMVAGSHGHNRIGRRCYIGSWGRPSGTRSRHNCMQNMRTSSRWTSAARVIRLERLFRRHARFGYGNQLGLCDGQKRHWHQGSSRRALSGHVAPMLAWTFSGSARAFRRTRDARLLPQVFCDGACHHDSRGHHLKERACSLIRTALLMCPAWHRR